jgi:hypothetical protein
VPDVTEQDDNLSYVIGEIEPPATSSVVAQFAASCRPCFQTHRVQLVQLFLSCDSRHAMLLFRAPDAESVRQVCRLAGMPVKRIWACPQPSHLELSSTSPS